MASQKKHQKFEGKIGSVQTRILIQILGVKASTEINILAVFQKEDDL